MVEVLANAADASQANSIGRGVFLIALLCLGLVVVLTGLVLAMLARRRARHRNLAKETQQRRADDPWRVSAERTDIPSAEELYRASGFDQDDTRIEDSPKFGDEGPDDSDGGSDGKGRRRKPKKPDQF